MAAPKPRYGWWPSKACAHVFNRNDKVRLRTRGYDEWVGTVTQSNSERTDGVVVVWWRTPFGASQGRHAPDHLELI